MSNAPTLSLALAALTAAACGGASGAGGAGGAPVTCAAGHVVHELRATAGAPSTDTWEYWCATRDGVADGPYLKLDVAGTALVRGAFAAGRADGDWHAVYADGATRFDHHFRAGVACGDWVDVSPAAVVAASCPVVPIGSGC